MSLFQNQQKPSLFSNSTQGSLLGNTGQSSLFGGQTGQSSLLGGQSSSLLGNRTTGQGSLLGTTGTGSLLGGGQQGGLLGGQTGQSSLLAGNREFSLSSGPSSDDNELKNVINDFYQAVNINNPTECKLRAPVYDEIPQPYINNPQYFWNNSYIPTLDQNTWNEMQKNNPDARKFYVSEIRGTDVLKVRIGNNRTLHENQCKKMDEMTNRLDLLGAHYDHELRSKIEQVKKQNYLLMDKLLTVHGMFENLALLYNEYDRKPNAEMRLLSAYNEMEQVPYEIKSKLMDLRSALEGAKLKRENRDTDDFKTLQPESKTQLLELLDKFKKGVETLDGIQQNNLKDVHAMQNYLNQQR